MALLNLNDIRLAYPATAGGSVRVLNGVSFEVDSSEFVALLGPSGCGKSSLLRVIAGLNTEYDGTLQFADSDLIERPLAISMNFQSPVLLPWLTVEENAFLPFEASSQPLTDEIRARFDRLVNLVGLNGFRTALPHELSGGMQMRVALVRSFITNPRLLLMDEPFASLDEVTRTRLGIELRSLAKSSGSPIVFVTHSIQEAIFLADRIVLLSARPARVVDEIVVDLPKKRGDEVLGSPEFVELTRGIRRRIAHD